MRVLLPLIRPTNHLLAGLAAADWQLLQPHLQALDVRQGELLHEAGSLLRHAYFPVSAVVSLISSLRNGEAAEAAMVGHEGLVGVGAILGGDMAYNGALVHGRGRVLRIPAHSLAECAQHSPALQAHLLAFAHALTTQITQTSACNRHHSVEQQLCRWLLLNQDRRGDAGLEITHERIAGLLGVRREGITLGAVKLRHEGVIDYKRGCLTIIDRLALEARSCECYGVVRQAYRQILGEPLMREPFDEAHIHPPERACALGFHGSQGQVPGGQDQLPSRRERQGTGSASWR